MAIFNNVESLLKELGLSNTIALLLIFILSLMIFSLKNYDKSEYEILLLSNFNKLMITCSKNIPMYVLIFIVSITTIQPKIFDMKFETFFLLSFTMIFSLLIIHIILIQVVGLTNLKNDYYLKIEDNDVRYKIIKLINNDIMLLENEDTKFPVYSTTWKDKQVIKEVRKTIILNDIYIGRDLKKAFKLSGLILFSSIIFIGIAILLYKESEIISYTVIFGAVAIVGILNIINIWLNYFIFWFINKVEAN